MGSSPLARGLRALVEGGGGHLRIIPARAGFTPSPSTACPALTDHPRSRGVYAFASQSSHNVAGSSPLARGLPTTGPSGTAQIGIIPARAGFTG